MAHYIKEFSREYSRLKQHGMTDDQIKDFYPLWLEIFRSNARFDNNTWRFGVGTTGSDIEGTIAIPWQYDGTQSQCRKYREAVKNAQDHADTSWTSKNLTRHDISTSDPDWSDFHEYDEELITLISSLSETDHLIIEHLEAHKQKQEVAEALGVTKKTVSSHMRTIKDTLEPYFRKYHLLSA